MFNVGDRVIVTTNAHGGGFMGKKGTVTVIHEDDGPLPIEVKLDVHPAFSEAMNQVFGDDFIPFDENELSILEETDDI